MSVLLTSHLRKLPTRYIHFKLLESHKSSNLLHVLPEGVVEKETRELIIVPASVQLQGIMDLQVIPSEVFIEAHV